MMRFGLMISAAALAFAGTASAQGYGYPSNDEVYRNYTQNYQPRNTACEKQRKNDKLAGQIVGAVAGGLLGGAIGNNIDLDNNHHRYRRGYGGYYDDYYGYGYRNARYDRRNHRRYDRRRSHKGENDGEVIVGALLGAVVGGFAGGSIAENTSSKCEAYGPTRAAPYAGYNSGYRNTGYNYGRSSGYGDRELYGGTAPAYPASRTYSTTARRTYTPQPAYGGRECRTVYRETRLPSGEVIRDPVQACRANPNAEWRVTETSTSYGY